MAVFLFTFLVQRSKVMEDNANAANLAAFDPGYIISDWQMGNYNSMNEAQIQSFLKSMNSCNDTYISRYTAGEKVSYFSEMSPPRTWHIKDGHFVCMADEVFDGGTAAHIIYKAAQDYKINPQVLLVLLEKEQSLVRDTFPHSQQYRSATGYGCPDTAACSSKYYGLQNQIRNAAALFRTVLDGGWTNYPLGNNYVQYNPNTACGGTVVNIRNLATSALYRYTPYQPNAATLAGGSNSCSAYGNLNFYRFFQDWFGGITDDTLPMPESSEISDGTYVLQSELNNKKVIDINGGVKNAKNGTNIQLFESNGTEAQQWKIQANNDGTYTIINPATNKVLDVEAGSTKDGANIQLYESNGTCAQRWRIVKGEGDNYTIYSACSGRVIDVSAGSTANGANIQIFAPNNTKAQKWKLVPVQETNGGNNQGQNSNFSDGTYVLQSELNNKKVIDINGGVKNAKNGTNIQLFESNGTEAQQWKIQANNDGTYTIINPATNKVLDVEAGSTKDGANIQLYESNGTCAQRWRIVKGEGDNYTIYSACSGRVIDVSAGSTANGANIQIFAPNNTKAQKWKLVRQ